MSPTRPQLSRCLASCLDQLARCHPARWSTQPALQALQGSSSVSTPLGRPAGAGLIASPGRGANAFSPPRVTTPSSVVPTLLLSSTTRPPFPTISTREIRFTTQTGRRRTSRWKSESRRAWVWLGRKLVGLLERAQRQLPARLERLQQRWRDSGPAGPRKDRAGANLFSPSQLRRRRSRLHLCHHYQPHPQQGLLAPCHCSQGSYPSKAARSYRWCVLVQRGQAGWGS